MLRSKGPIGRAFASLRYKGRTTLRLKVFSFRLRYKGPTVRAVPSLRYKGPTLLRLKVFSLIEGVLGSLGGAESAQVPEPSTLRTQRTQYPLNKEYTLDHKIKPL